MSLTFNLADMWEAVQPLVAERTALVVDDVTRTYAELEERANRLADHLTSIGIGPGDHVGCYLYNCPEYVETFIAAFKIRAVPVNVNYRYVADELRYLCNDADLKVIVHDVEFTDRVDAIRGDLPLLRETLSVGAGGTYNAALAGASPERKQIERSADDHYIVYTGGTTGMPKGVVWRHEDAFYACFGGGDWTRQNPIVDPAEVTQRLQPTPVKFFALAPLMHGAAQWTIFAMMLAGGTGVLTASRPSTDYSQVWRLITTHGVNTLTIIGDAVARPLIDEYHANKDREGYDASTLFSIGSGAVPLSPAGREELQRTFPNVIVTDGYGASETGAQAGNLGDGRFRSYDRETLVLDPLTFEPIPPGSEQEGRVARRGHIPLGYYNDEQKTKETFVEHGGERWVLTGDVATVAEDGTITLRGRGSLCINTGGEKVFPEEVESVLVAHPDVHDVLVVGVPDPRWGQKVAAVVQVAPGSTADHASLEAHCREKLAAYKVPRAWTFVDTVRRSPSGKADYAWAKQTAAETIA
jgi:acyl-CoA synthetase (AMP-forming)/AMP-acid ligase II